MQSISLNNHTWLHKIDPKSTSVFKVFPVRFLLAWDITKGYIKGELKLQPNVSLSTFPARAAPCHLQGSEGEARDSAGYGSGGLIVNTPYNLTEQLEGWVAWGLCTLLIHIVAPPLYASLLSSVTWLRKSEFSFKVLSSHAKILWIRLCC